MSPLGSGSERREVHRVLEVHRPRLRGGGWRVGMPCHPPTPTVGATSAVPDGLHALKLRAPGTQEFRVGRVRLHNAGTGTYASRSHTFDGVERPRRSSHLTLLPPSPCL